MRLFTAAAYDNLTATLHMLVCGLSAKVTQHTIQETLLSHPDFPSLLSMSDALTDWNIDNTALQLNTVEQLRELPMPFIAHLKTQGGWYVLVNYLNQDLITYTDSERGRITETLTEFEKQWTGVVLLAETDTQSGEADYATKRKQERLTELRDPFVVVGTLLVFLLVILIAAKDLNAPAWLLVVTKALGLGVSSLLVAKQLGNKNALADRLCSLGNQTNCDDILNSPAAKLWGWLSWADVGLLYFAGGLLALLTMGNIPGAWPLLNILALLALPYTIFSIYYQARVVRQWCTLCLLVQGVLLSEGALALTQSFSLPGTWQPYGLLLTAFLIPTLGWVLVKPLLVSQTKSRREHAELMALKRDPKLFNALLRQQPQMPPIPDDLHPIVLGNPDAEHTVTVVTNPYCGPCATTHSELENLLSHNANVKANLIFASGSEKGTRVVMHIIALTEQGNAKAALTDWYSQQTKNYDTWAERYPVAINEPDLMAAAERYGQWCHKAGIIATPTLYVDGYQLPNIYRLDGLRWLIDESVEAEEKAVLNMLNRD